MDLEKVLQSGAICGEAQVHLVAVPVAELQPLKAPDVGWKVQVVVLDTAAGRWSLDGPAGDLDVSLRHCLAKAVQVAPPG